MPLGQRSQWCITRTVEKFCRDSVPHISSIETHLPNKPRRNCRPASVRGSAIVKFHTFEDLRLPRLCVERKRMRPDRPEYLYHADYHLLLLLPSSSSPTTTTTTTATTTPPSHCYCYCYSYYYYYYHPYYSYYAYYCDYYYYYYSCCYYYYYYYY